MNNIYKNVKEKIQAYKNPISEIELSNTYLFVKTYSSAAGVSREREEDLNTLQEVDLGLSTPLSDSQKTIKAVAPIDWKPMYPVSHRIIEVDLLFKKRIHKVQLDLYIDREHQKLLSKNGYTVSVATQELGQASIYEKLLSEIYRGNKFVPDEHNKIKSVHFFNKIDKNLNAQDNVNKLETEIRLEQALTEFAFSEVERSITAIDRDIVKASIYEFIFGDKAHPTTEAFIEDYKKHQLKK